jgi:hypothetical protein
VQVLLSPPIVVCSPSILPVYVYDAHAECGKNVRCVECPVYLLENDKTTTPSQLSHNPTHNGPHTIVSGVVRELCKGVVSQSNA